MQVYVLRSDLSNTTTPVHGLFPDSAICAIGDLGANFTLLSVPDTDVDQSTLPPTLVSTFRNDMPQMVNYEAGRRILLGFSADMQRNANADVNRSIMLYGADHTTWPSDAQARKTEGDRGWSYISAVRQTADTLATQTTLVDPTADSNWPAALSPPIYIEPTP